MALCDIHKERSPGDLLRKGGFSILKFQAILLALCNSAVSFPWGEGLPWEYRRKMSVRLASLFLKACCLFLWLVCRPWLNVERGTAVLGTNCQPPLQMSNINSLCWLCYCSWKTVNGLLASGGLQTWRLVVQMLCSMSWRRQSVREKSHQVLE